MFDCLFGAPCDVGFSALRARGLQLVVCLDGAIRNRAVDMGPKLVSIGWHYCFVACRPSNRSRHQRRVAMEREKTGACGDERCGKMRSRRYGLLSLFFLERLYIGLPTLLMFFSGLEKGAAIVRLR